MLVSMLVNIYKQMNKLQHKKKYLVNQHHLAMKCVTTSYPCLGGGWTYRKPWSRIYKFCDT